MLPKIELTEKQDAINFLKRLHEKTPSTLTNKDTLIVHDAFEVACECKHLRDHYKVTIKYNNRRTTINVSNADSVATLINVYNRLASTTSIKVKRLVLNVEALSSTFPHIRLTTGDPMPSELRITLPFLREYRVNDPQNFPTIDMALKSSLPDEIYMLGRGHFPDAPCLTTIEDLLSTDKFIQDIKRIISDNETRLKANNEFEAANELINSLT